MRFLVDESLSPKLAQLLREADHDAVHLRERGMQGAEDAAVLSLAEAEDRVLVSADADFGALLTLGTRRKPSLILFRGGFYPRAREQAALLISSLPELSEHLRNGAIAVLSGTQIRLRTL